MTILTTYDIKGHDDFELGIKRENLLRYHIAYQDDKKPNGIVFYIPGFGEDTALSYGKKLIAYISGKYNYLAVLVEYHAMFARQYKEKESASIVFSNYNKEIISQYASRLNINIDINNINIDSVNNSFDKKLLSLKQENKIDKDYKVHLWATLLPYKEEYQNFGVLQTIDILTVLYDLKQKGYGKLIKKKPLAMIGSSHGAYIANMVMKFAPNTFDLIIDNSSYIQPNLRYIVGFEKDPFNAEVTFYYDNIVWRFFTYSYWTLKDGKYKFADKFYTIRDLSDKNQFKQFLKQTNGGGKTDIITYHSIFDTVASYKKKAKYIKWLKKNRYNVVLNTIDKDTIIDGRFIKRLTHAMGMSLKELVDKELPKLQKKQKKIDIFSKSTIRYDMEDGSSYVIRFKKDSISAKIKS